MIQYDAMQTAPAIIVLIGRTVKRIGKLRAGQEIQRILNALEDQDVTPC